MKVSTETSVEEQSVCTSVFSMDSDLSKAYVFELPFCAWCEDNGSVLFFLPLAIHFPVSVAEEISFMLLAPLSQNEDSLFSILCHRVSLCASLSRVP